VTLVDSPEEAEIDRRYTITICKGAGLLAETRQLVQHWRPGEAVDPFVHRVLEEDLLGRYTALRAQDIARRVFARRFLRPTDRPARILKGILEHGLPSRTFTELLFLFACRADDLLYDFTILVYWAAARRGRLRLALQDAIDFLAEAAGDGRIPQPWSELVQVKIARGLLGMLRDVHFLREQGKGHQDRDILPYHVSDEGVAILARELHERGTTDSGIPEHPDWELFGLSRGAVIERLDTLGEQRGLMVQRAGSVVSITWRVQSMEDLIDALAR
jgi:hypothetical protein